MRILMRQHLTRWLILVGTVIILFSGMAAAAADESSPAPGREMARQATKTKRPGITVDHSRLPALNKPFKSGPEITKACQSCHTEAESQFHQTIHWTWKADDNIRGKAGYSVNNFCISSNKMQDKGCLSCHPGWNKSMESINCLVCHGQKDINWEESFQDLNALSASKDPEEVEIAKEIRDNIQACCPECRASGTKELRFLSFLRRWWRRCQTWRSRLFPGKAEQGLGCPHGNRWTEFPLYPVSYNEAP